MKRVMIVFAGIGIAAVVIAGGLLIAKKVNSILEDADDDNDDDFDAFEDDFDDFEDECDEKLQYVDIFPTKAEAKKMEEEASK